MTLVDVQQQTLNAQQHALDVLHRELKAAGLPGVEVLPHPQHLAVVTDIGDFAVWVSPWGGPFAYKVEGAGDSYRCSSAAQVVDILREVTTP